LRTSPVRSSQKCAKKVSKIAHLSDASTPDRGVCCNRYVRRGAGLLPALLLDQGSLPLGHQAATSSNGPPKHGSGRTVSPRAEALPREERACNKIRASQRWSRKSLSARQGVCSSAAGAHHRRHSKL